MKRSRENEKIVATTTKNDLPRPAKKPKVVEVSVFDWLPLELFQKILEGVPWELDGVMRLVSSTWYATMDRRWNPKKRTHINQTTVPCVRWALRHDAFKLLKWMLLDVKVKRFAKEPLFWMDVACRAGNAKTIAWLFSQEAPDRVRSHEPSLSNLYDVAKYGDVACYRLIFGLSGKGQPNPEDVHQACLGGNLETAKWILSRYNPKDWPTTPYTRPRFRDCVRCACWGGHIDTVDWLLGSYGMGTKAVGMFGHRELCSDFIESALARNHVDMAEHLVRRWKCPMDSKAVFQVCMQSCQLKTIQWAIGATSDMVKEHYTFGLRHFAKYRHFEILDLLAATNKIKLDITPQTFLWGICNNNSNETDPRNLAMVKWLWLHCDQTAVRHAMGGHRVQRGCLDATNELFKKVLMGGHLDVLQWLYARGLGWFSSKKQAEKFTWGILRTLGQRCQMGPDAPPNARKSKAVLFWLHQHRVVDLSQARILANGNVWFHLNCRHRLKICLELKRYWARPQGELLPWNFGHVTGKLFLSQQQHQ